MITLNIQVKPGASRDEVYTDTYANLIVKIRAKPIEGRANDYLIKYLAREFNISRSKIQIEKGTTSRFKRINLYITQLEWEEKSNKYKK